MRSGRSPSPEPAKTWERLQFRGRQRGDGLGLGRAAGLSSRLRRPDSRLLGTFAPKLRYLKVRQFDPLAFCPNLVRGRVARATAERTAALHCATTVRLPSI